jgi:Sec-independent protein secretion pathway component TatC
MLFFIAAAIFSGRHPGRGLMNAAPVLALVGLWLVAAWWLARREERRRLRQLAEIDATRAD